MRIEIIKSAAPRPLANYSECFKFGPWVFAAGQIASDYKTGVAPEEKVELPQTLPESTPSASPTNAGETAETPTGDGSNDSSVAKTSEVPTAEIPAAIESQP